MSHHDDFSDEFPMNDPEGEAAFEELKAEFDAEGHATEDTIYAWLDEALDETESAKVEQHVTACDVCSAAVAEARGFIAASARIISSLDFAPKNVVPHDDVARTAARIVAAEDAQIKANISAPKVSTVRKQPWYRQSAFRIAAGIVVMLGGASYVVNANRKQLITGVSVVDSLDAPRVGSTTDRAAPVIAGSKGNATSDSVAVTSPPVVATTPASIPSQAKPEIVASAPANARNQPAASLLRDSKARAAEPERKKDENLAKTAVTADASAGAKGVIAPAAPVPVIALPQPAPPASAMGGVAAELRGRAAATVAAAPPPAPSKALAESRATNSLAARADSSTSHMTIVGKVTSVDKDALQNANVLVVGAPISVATDSSGNFIIRNVPKKSLQLMARSIGFKAQASSLQGDGDTVHVTFALERDVNRLSDVVTTSVDGAAARKDSRCLRAIGDESASPLIRELQGRLPTHGEFTLTILGWPNINSRTAGTFTMEKTNEFRGTVERDGGTLEITLHSSDGRWIGTATSSKGKQVQKKDVTFVMETVAANCAR